MVTMRGKGWRVFAPPSIAMPRAFAFFNTLTRIAVGAGMGEADSCLAIPGGRAWDPDCSRCLCRVLVGRGLPSLLKPPASAISTPLSSLRVWPLSDNWERVVPLCCGLASADSRFMSVTVTFCVRAGELGWSGL